MAFPNEIRYDTTRSLDQGFLMRVGMGLEPGYSSVEKFGENPDIDTDDAPETIWSGGGLLSYSDTANIDSMSSSDVDDEQEITIQGLDADYNLVTQTKALTGQTTVELDTPLIRVFRAFNSNGTPTEGNVWIYINGASVTAGVPTVQAEKRLVIKVDAQQTEMCTYTIPAGYTGYFIGGYVSLSRVLASATAIFTSRIRNFEGVFRVASRISCIGSGRSSWDYRYPVPIELPAKTDIELRCEAVASNNTGVSGGFTILLKENR